MIPVHCDEFVESFEKILYNFSERKYNAVIQYCLSGRMPATLCLLSQMRRKNYGIE